MLTPGRHYVGSTVRLEINFSTEDGTDVDPTTITFEMLSPSGEETSYVYGTDSELVRVNAGDYYVDFTVDESGRWHFRWTTTGSSMALLQAGSFVVQRDPWSEGVVDAYRR